MFLRAKRRWIFLYLYGRAGSNCVIPWIRKVGKKDERNADLGSKWN